MILTIITLLAVAIGVAMIRKDEYEDVSKSDVIKDISEWNKKVYGYKHWAYNPWTNWFYSKRVADDMKMIERKPKGAEHD